MISSITNQNLQKIVISTGNILNNKLGRKPHEELMDGLKLTLCDLNCDEKNVQTCFEPNKLDGKVQRGTADLHTKITEHERSGLGIGAKIFLNKSKNGAENIQAAVNSILEILNLQHVDNVVIAYHPEPRVDCNSSTPTTPLTAGSDGGTGTGGGGVGGLSGKLFKWHSRNDETVEQLIKLWATLEEFALDKKINQLGVSDLDAETLKQLYDAARIKPSIAQINLSSCCVVPPALKEFCTQHDIQLLTHGDPETLMPLNEQFIIPNFELDWTLRYQVHVRCRGVVVAKGFIVGASNKTKHQVD